MATAGGILRIAAELDVGAASGHVGGDRHPTLGSRLRDDQRLPRVRLGIEHFVLDPATVQQLRELLGLLDGDGADQHRLPRVLTGSQLIADRGHLVLLVEEDHVVVVGPDQRTVGGYDHHVQAVDVAELRRLGIGRAGHAGQLVVELEVVLKGDRGQRPVALEDLDALLRLDRLVQSVRIAPAMQNAAGELVDDLHGAVLDHVVHVPLEQPVGAQRLGEVVDELEVLVLYQRSPDQALAAQHAFGCGDPFVGERDALALLVDLVVADRLLGVVVGLRILRALAERAHQPIDLGEPLRVVFGRPGDDQRGPCLVDQDRVDLVHDAIPVTALHASVGVPAHVVAQVVESQLVVGAVGDVAGVRLGPFAHLHARQDDPDVQAQVAVHAAHPFGVAFGQVVVDRDDVDAGPGERVEIGGGDAGEGLSLAGLHLDDRAAVQDDSPHELDVEDALAELPAGGLTRQRERLRQDLVARFARLEPRPQPVRPRREVGFGESDHPRLQLVDPVHERNQGLQITVGL